MNRTGNVLWGIAVFELLTLSAAAQATIVEVIIRDGAGVPRADIPVAVTEGGGREFVGVTAANGVVRIDIPDDAEGGVVGIFVPQEPSLEDMMALDSSVLLASQQRIGAAHEGWCYSYAVGVAVLPNAVTHYELRAYETEQRCIDSVSAVDGDVVQMHFTGIYGFFEGTPVGGEYCFDELPVGYEDLAFVLQALGESAGVAVLDGDDPDAEIVFPTSLGGEGDVVVTLEYRDESMPGLPMAVAQMVTFVNKQTGEVFCVERAFVYDEQLAARVDVAEARASLPQGDYWLLPGPPYVQGPTSQAILAARLGNATLMGSMAVPSVQVGAGGALLTVQVNDLVRRLKDAL
ncbi:MAG: hypothetical protein AAGG07_12260 [Planctomycetota bacterium]